MLSRSILIGAFVAGMLVSSVPAQTTGSATQTLALGVTPLASVTVPGTLTMVSSGTTFSNPFTGTMTVNYQVRSTSGGGNITLRATSNFPAGGPSIGSGDLTYTCSSATYGTDCSGIQIVSLSSTPVLTFPSLACTGGGSPCSAASPNTQTLFFSLVDRVRYSTGTYTINIQFTASAV